MIYGIIKQYYYESTALVIAMNNPQGVILNAVKNLRMIVCDLFITMTIMSIKEVNDGI
jgi:hypothetical protein